MSTTQTLKNNNTGSESPGFDPEFWYGFHRKVDTKIMKEIREKNGTTVVNGVVCTNRQQASD